MGGDQNFELPLQIPLEEQYFIISEFHLLLTLVQFPLFTTLIQGLHNANEHLRPIPRLAALP
jgi:hypothetical protein